ncbi:BPSS1780 family membrane protein [Kangiella sp. HZ709]|uniref:BPSS1780 family membrane protein n=1 Tax=Kangiella sp. HZ709 TaxID=2666328 RepID=UPI0012B0B546|nr:BPSS1780 family membrane protein [Kangiella sp. HZ709]MRX28566.1 hypothetical protein [Kangiella sp. HZ709]
MNEQDNNPYQAPEADIQTPENEGELLATPNTVPIGRGFTWLEKGISNTLKPQIGMWMLIGLVYVIISLVLNFIPIINMIVPTLLAPVFAAGLALGAHRVYTGEKLEIGQLFAGFSLPQSSQLFLFGLITIVVYIALFMLMFAFVGFDFITLMMSGDDPDPAVISSMMGKFILLIPLGLIAGVIFLLALWFPPTLIGLHGISAMQALKLGFKGATKNIGAVVVFLLMLIVLGIAVGIIFALLMGIIGFISQTMALVLMFIIMIPLALLAVGFWAGTTYHAYRDIFIGEE